MLLHYYLLKQIGTDTEKRINSNRQLDTGFKLVVITKHNLILMGINLCLSVECEMLHCLEVCTMSTPNAFTND